MRKTSIGLALGGGAARGWAHIGVIEALTEAGIVPDVVCGTSMGALVGGVYAAGQLDRLRDWTRTADRRVITSMIDVGVLAGGLIDGVRVVEWLNGMGLGRTIEELPLPYAAVATDITTGREIWLRSGPLSAAIRASIGLPGIFSPTRIEDDWLVDGGLVNPVPVSVCRALGADFIIAVHVNDEVLGRPLVPEVASQTPTEAAAKPANWVEAIKSMPASIQAQLASIKLFGSASTTPGYFDVLINSINIMQDHITRSRLAGEPPHLLVLPRVGGVGLLDFHRAEEAIAEGRAAVERILPALEATLRLR